MLPKAGAGEQGGQGDDGQRGSIGEAVALYDRLGGVYSIATVVEDLIDQVMVDPRLDANPRVMRRITKCRRQGSSIW
jgi:hypothetical protein